MTIRGRWVVGLVACGVVVAAVRPAEACEPPPELAIFPQVQDGSIAEVPTDGVIAFRAEAYGELAEAMGLLAIEVTQDDMPVDGAIETVEISTSDEFGSTRTDLFVVWRPAAAFAASTSYAATVTIADPWNPKGEPDVVVLDVTTGTGAADALPEPSFGDAALAAMRLDAGPRVCCDVGNSCGFADCRAPDQADQPTLTADVVAGTGPMLSQTYLRVRAGVDGATEEYAVLGIAAAADGATLQRSFPEAADSYCFGIEAVSLIDGSTAEVVTSCVDHGGLELGAGPNPDFAGFLDQCIGDPYWEDTMEPYEPGGTTGDSGGSEEADGGSTDDDGTDGGEATNEDDGDSGDDSADDSADDSGGQAGDGDGCACDVDGDRGGVGAGLWLIVGALARRRRS